MFQVRDASSELGKVKDNSDFSIGEVEDDG